MIERSTQADDHLAAHQQRVRGTRRTFLLSLAAQTAAAVGLSAAGATAAVPVLERAASSVDGIGLALIALAATTLIFLFGWSSRLAHAGATAAVGAGLILTTAGGLEYLMFGIALVAAQVGGTAGLLYVTSDRTG